MKDEFVINDHDATKLTIVTLLLSPVIASW